MTLNSIRPRMPGALMYPVLFAGAVIAAALGSHPHVLHATAAPDGASAPSRPAPSTERLSCTQLPNVPGKSMIVTRVDFPPGALSPPHRHPGAVTAYVLKGRVRSQMEGGAPQTYAAGGTWFEAPRALHQLAENPSPDEPAQLLAVFVADDNCGPLVIPEPDAAR
jgi:quercetin dioxygenase-like cupin family protein